MAMAMAMAVYGFLSPFYARFAQNSRLRNPRARTLAPTRRTSAGAPK
jgi:hypothetical protein